MNENKTKPSNVPIEDFINNIEDESVRNDSLTLCAMMAQATGELPVLWGESMVGFGTLRYKYPTGREGDTFLVGFSPRTQKFSVYLMAGLARYPELLAKLGKHSLGKSCLYIKNLKNIDRKVLQELIDRSVTDIKQHGPAY